jgi:hypothetical protein
MDRGNRGRGGLGTRSRRRPGHHRRRIRGRRRRPARLDIAALFAVAPGDRYVTVDEMQSVYQAASAAPKQLVVLPDGAGHGWEMLTDASGSGWSPLAMTIASWTHGSHR